MKKIMIAAAGTGGHIFPGLAVAQVFLNQGDEVVWVGTEQGLENKLVPAQGIKLLKISMQGLRGKGLLRVLMAPYLLMQGIVAARKLIQQEQPDLVLGMGGYVSAPVGIAAKLCGVPLVIHEQNAITGMANKLLSKIANRVCESFPKTFPAAQNAVYTGNPVRTSIAAVKTKHLAKPFDPTQPLRLLVLGGSLGARAINEVIPGLLNLYSSAEKLEIWHQTGAKDFEAVKTQYAKENKHPFKLVEFIDDVDSAYSWADLIICRAGATTVAELATVGLPAILIPLPTAVDDHQTANARNLVKQGSAVILPQNELSSARLSQEIREFCANFDNLTRHASQANKEAAFNVVQVCRRIMK
ncbi:MAG: undecaprenyldiphospho-muramoylpentapeptide beta-N-acetylglucosaminyltransferase [Legionellales bacterium]|nr:undecaprenyldiphospho-muramoylpentapeptide beta-N-acetylglucosaminyltransferase [Legionellales bacterium]